MVSGKKGKKNKRQTGAYFLTKHIQNFLLISEQRQRYQRELRQHLLLRQHQLRCQHLP